MDLQIRLRTSRLDMILDILSRTTVSYLQQNNNRCLNRPYCIPPLNALLLSLLSSGHYCLSLPHLLLSSPSYCSGSRLSLLFSLRHSHAIVLCRTIALSCISRVNCTLWSHSSFPLTVVPGQFLSCNNSSFPLTVVPACLTSFCAYHPLRSSLTLLAQPCDLP